MDPACGSGHFLLAAARRMAAEIARIESASDVPDEETRRHALREVVRHCIYGVDKNPLSVELCRTALWIETIEPGKPLSFLDAHIRCGDSLVGVFDPKIMEEGIPPEAYAALSGDEKTVCSALKAENKKVKIGHATQGDLFDQEGFQKQATEAGRFEAMPEDTVEQIAAKQKAWAEAVSASRENRDRLRADLFVGAFLTTKTAGTKAVVPTNADLNKVLAELPPRPGVADFARELAVKHQTFHWFLEFPHVFARTLSGSRTPGFDVVLGNPPWERIKLQEQEFFAARNPAIAAAPNQAARGRLIAALNRPDAPPSDRALWNEFQAARHDAEAASQFTRESGRFPLTGCGDVNTYALFSELFLNLPNQSGRAGLIVPSGIATDDSTKKFFGEISGTNRLARLADFENSLPLFSGVHRSYKFVLLTIGRNEPKGVFSFFAQQPSDLEDERRIFTLTAADIALINPNTRTCPVFRTTADAEITKKIYSRIPVLINEAAGAEGNPWGITFMRMFDMSNDSGLFKTYAQLAATQGLELRGNCFYEKARPADSPDTASLDRPNPAWLPLYEAKMIHQFDHRWATYETDGETVRNVTPEEKADPAFQPLPRYWVPAEEVYLKITRIPPGLKQGWIDSDDKVMRYVLAYWLAGYFQNHGESRKCNTIVQNILGGGLSGPFQAVSDWLGSQKTEKDYPLTDEEHRSILAALTEGPKADIHAFVTTLIIHRSPKWLLGWRDITNATNERTIIAAIFPRAASGDTLLLKFPFNATPVQCAALNANLDSLICDYVARQKIGGTHLKYHVFRQIAVLPAAAYSDADLGFIAQRQLELLCISNDMRDVARDIIADCRQRGIALNILCIGISGQAADSDDIPEQYEYIPERRAVLRAELDAYYAYLYGLTRDELRYVLDPADVHGEEFPGETFRVLKNNEMRQFGEYRTRRLVLEAWDRLTADGTFARRGPPPDFSAEIAQAALRAATPPEPESEPSKKPSRAKKTVSRSKKAPSAAPAAPSDTTSPTMKDLFDIPTDDTSNE
ncbi:MAG TPA: N-6 DNA methylase [Candidatus Ozemobacteraceae bacterium]|nr:N-6 DNA methylase [Candidatus Ozemobacteraceae bacterium]